MEVVFRPDLLLAALHHDGTAVVEVDGGRQGARDDELHAVADLFPDTRVAIHLVEVLAHVPPQAYVFCPEEDVGDVAVDCCRFSSVAV